MPSFLLQIGLSGIRLEHILRPEALEILRDVKGLKALVNITSGGLLNLNRVDADISFLIDRCIEPHPTFRIIQRYSEASDVEMFGVFNMGTGFCYIVAPESADQTIGILEKHGRKASPIGRAVAGADKTASIPEWGLKGRDKTFRKVEASRRVCSDLAVDVPTEPVAHFCFGLAVRRRGNATDDDQQPCNSLSCRLHLGPTSRVT